MKRPESWADLSSEHVALLEGLLAEHETELERAVMLQALLEPGNEAAFLRRYFPHVLTEELEDFHMRLIESALYEPRDLVLFPAGHGKSTLISQLLPILEICRNPNIRIVLVAKNDDEAAANMTAIKAELTSNELLIQDFGPFVPPTDSGKRWQSTWIDVARRTINHKSPTIAAFGSGAKNVLGHRSDWVICDDVVTEKNSATDEQRAKMLDWFTTSVETSPQKIKGSHGRVTVVGTMFHPHDLYFSIQRKRDSEGKAIYKFHREDAIVDEAKQLVLWPAVWTWKEMMDLKFNIGTLSFNKRYRNMPVDESEQPFRESWIRGIPDQFGDHRGCLDYDRKLKEYEPDWRIFQSIDPAVGSTRSAKFVAHLVFGIAPEAPEEIRLIEIERLQLTVPQQADRLIDTALAYPNMMTTVIEVNAYQKGLEQIVNDRCAEAGVTLNVTGHTTGRNKQDPTIGVASLSPLVENGRLRLPYGDEESIRKSEMLIQEMVEYPYFAYSDLLMALWFGTLHARNAVQVMRSWNRLDPKSRYRKRSVGRVRKNPHWQKGVHIMETEEPHADA